MERRVVVNAEGKKIEMRIEVEKFAEAMEKELQANEWKGGWLQEDVRNLLLGIYENTAELGMELQGSGERGKILKTAADIGNYAMMIADLYGELGGEEEKEE